uniref:Uncharacterized protein n=1 Tax=Cacopsylla melanoneura TaxID=428564 RepID=A0A8D8QCP6_9HEMI
MVMEMFFNSPKHFYTARMRLKSPFYTQSLLLFLFLLLLSVTDVDLVITHHVKLTSKFQMHLCDFSTLYSYIKFYLCGVNPGNTLYTSHGIPLWSRMIPLRYRMGYLKQHLIDLQ